MQNRKLYEIELQDFNTPTRNPPDIAAKLDRIINPVIDSIQREAQNVIPRFTVDSTVFPKPEIFIPPQAPMEPWAWANGAAGAGAGAMDPSAGAGAATEAASVGTIAGADTNTAAGAASETIIEAAAVTTSAAVYPTTGSEIVGLDSPKAANAGPGAGVNPSIPVAMDEKEIQIRQKFAEVQLDSAAIKRLSIALCESSLEKLYEKYIALTKWNVKHVPELKNCLSKLNVNPDEYKHEMEPTDKLYILFYLIIRDNKSKESIRNLFSSKPYLGCLASGLPEFLIQDWENAYGLFNRTSFAKLPLPTKLALSDFLNTLSDAPERAQIRSYINDFGHLPHPLQRLITNYLPPKSLPTEPAFTILFRSMRDDIGVEEALTKMKDFLENPYKYGEPSCPQRKHNTDDSAAGTSFSSFFYRGNRHQPRIPIGYPIAGNYFVNPAQANGMRSYDEEITNHAQGAATQLWAGVGAGAGAGAGAGPGFNIEPTLSLATNSLIFSAYSGQPTDQQTQLAKSFALLLVLATKTDMTSYTNHFRPGI